MAGADRAAPRPVVLAVDDEPSVREVFRLLLDDHVELLLAADAATALDILRSRAVDLVLLDVLMPGEDGIQALERLREFNPTVKVVIVSAVDNARTAVAAMRLGAIDYVIKPFDDDALVGLVLGACEPAPASVVVVGADVGMRAAVAAVLARRGHQVAARKMVPAYLPPGAAVVDLSRGPEPAEALAAALPGAPALGSLAWRVVEHVARHYRMTTVEDMAALLQVSRRRLVDTFQAETQMTIRDYLARVRLEAAKQFLRDDRESLSAVARRVGFCDASHLCRVFRQHGQSSPGAWRQSVQRNPRSIH